jgi:hypothetical protein
MKTHDQEKNEDLWLGKECRLMIRKRMKSHDQEKTETSWSGNEWRLIIQKHIKQVYILQFFESLGFKDIR